MKRGETGTEVIIEGDAQPVAVLRTISECIALAKAHEEEESGESPILCVELILDSSVVIDAERRGNSDVIPGRQSLRLRSFGDAELPMWGGLSACSLLSAGFRHERGCRTRPSSGAFEPLSRRVIGSAPGGVPNRSAGAGADRSAR